MLNLRNKVLYECFCICALQQFLEVHLAEVHQENRVSIFVGLKPSVGQIRLDFVELDEFCVQVQVYLLGFPPFETAGEVI